MKNKESMNINDNLITLYNNISEKDRKIVVDMLIEKDFGIPTHNKKIDNKEVEQFCFYLQQKGWIFTDFISGRITYFLVPTFKEKIKNILNLI